MFFLIVNVSANNFAIELNTQQSSYDNFQITYLKDNNSSLSIEDVINRKFDKTSRNQFTLGYTKGDVWIKLNVKNDSIHDAFIISLGESFYESAVLYYFDQNSTLLKKHNGLFIPVDQREVITNKIAFEVSLPKNTTTTFYLKIHGKYAYFGNITLETKKYFYAHGVFNINSLYLIIFGIVFAIIVFNIFLYLKVKERIYFYYVGYAFFNLVYMSNISGILVYLNLQKHIYDLQLSAAFMIGFLTLFSFEYLSTNAFIKKYKLYFKSLSVPFFILGVLVVFSYQPWNKFINNLAGLICIILIIISTISYFKGHTKTKYYIFAMLLYFTFVILFTFMVLGVLEYNNLTRYGFIIASAFETVIFSLILSNRYNELKEEVITSQNDLIKQKHENEIFLESEVEKRTNQLRQNYDQIKTLLSEKNLLLKEVHHRVKNNFHMISGLLWFEEQRDPKEAEKFQNIKNRIKSMSMIHEKLYKSEKISSISLKEYLEEITTNLLSSYKHLPIKLDQHIENIYLDFEYALALGIILNEVVSNSLKHNQDAQHLYITIDLHKEDSVVLLEITDNGKGFPTKVHSDGIGMSLIESFTSSLPEAKYNFSSNNGVTFTLKFQVDKGQDHE